MSAKKRKSLGTPSAPNQSISTAASGLSLEEQRKRARLWKEEQLLESSTPAASKPATSIEIAKKPDRRASIATAAPANRTAASTPSTKTTASRKSLAPDMLTRRSVASPARQKAVSPIPSPSPPPKRAKVDLPPTGTSKEEQQLRAQKWRDEVLAQTSTASVKPSAPANRRKSVGAGAERVPQKEFSESELPESLRPSRISSAAATQPTPRAATRRASLDTSVLSSSKIPVATLRGPAARVPVPASSRTPALSARKRPATPDYVSEDEESSEDDATTIPIIAPTRRQSSGQKLSTRASFSAARRSSAGSAAFDEAMYAYPADFRHQFVDRGRHREDASSPETIGTATPLIGAISPPSTVRSRRAVGRRESGKSSIKKKLIPAESESEEVELMSEESEEKGEDSGGNSLSFLAQKRRAEEWRKSQGWGSGSKARPSESPKPARRSESGSGSGGTHKKANMRSEEEGDDAVDDPDAIEMAEAPEPIQPAEMKTLQQKKSDAWLKEVVCFFSGVIGLAAFMALRAEVAKGASFHQSFPLIPTLDFFEETRSGLNETFFNTLATFNNGFELTLALLRAVSLTLLAVVVVAPIVYGLFTMAMWCWSNSKKKANLIETMAAEAKELLFEKYNGGPYPVEFLMEFLMDKYRREGTGRATELLAPGETLNRAAFRQLWPSVQQEVTADSRIEVLKKTFEGKTRECWRVVGGESTVRSTHLKGDFPTDDFGHEDAHSTSSYTPAKVQGAGVSFL